MGGARAAMAALSPPTGDAATPMATPLWSGPLVRERVDIDTKHALLCINVIVLVISIRISVHCDSVACLHKS